MYHSSTIAAELPEKRRSIFRHRVGFNLLHAINIAMFFFRTRRGGMGVKVKNMKRKITKAVWNRGLPILHCMLRMMGEFNCNAICINSSNVTVKSKTGLHPLEERTAPSAAILVTLMTVNSATRSAAAATLQSLNRHDPAPATPPAPGCACMYTSFRRREVNYSSTCVYANTTKSAMPAL